MTEPDTCVLIATVNRPHFLETALDSVARQGARGRIKEVRVMENGGGRASEAVCARFADRLPIRYVFRQPCLTPIEHGRLIIDEVYPSRYIAILHDDDWWSPEHLASSLLALETNAAAACYSAFFDVPGEAAPLVCDGSLMFWLASGFGPVTRDWVLDLGAMLAGSLPGTPGRFSTLVAKADAFRECGYISRLDNEFDNDRMLGVALALKGKIVYRPVPSAFIRYHASQDSRSFSQQKQTEQMARTTLWLFSVARDNRIDLIHELQVRLDACPEPYRKAVLGRLTVPFLYNMLRKHPRLPPALLEFWVQAEAAKRG